VVEMGELPFAKKGLGQHWLADPATLESIVQAARLGPKDTVLEIGPGLGTLTEVIVATGAQLVALEYDSSLIKDLRKKFRAKPVEIVEGDIRQYDFSLLPNDYKIVANIPYYLTANLFRALIDTGHKPAIAVLLVQKEVAQRVTAKPGQLTFVALALQTFYEVGTGQDVPATLFTPKPKVDSQVLILKRRAHSLVKDLNTDKFFSLVKAGFSERRKKLKTSLKTGVGSGEDVQGALIRARISPDARAQELSLDDWQRLYRSLYGHNPL